MSEIERPIAIVPVTGTLDTPGQRSDPFAPLPGRPFNVTIDGSFVGTLYIYRSFDQGETWQPCTNLGKFVALNTPASEVVEEHEIGVIYSLLASAIDGSVSYRFSQ